MADDPSLNEIAAELQEDVAPSPERAQDPLGRLEVLEKQAKEAFLAKDLERMRPIDAQMQKIYDDEVVSIDKSIADAQYDLQYKLSHTPVDSSEHGSIIDKAQQMVDSWTSYQKDFKENAEEKLNTLQDSMDELENRQVKPATTFTPETQDPQKAIDLIMKKIAKIQKKLGEDAAYAMREAEAKKISDAVKAK